MLSRPCTIDQKQVKCPNASTLGYGLWKARPGHCITYKQHLSDGSYNVKLGRVLGRIAYAPSAGTESPAIENYLLVMELSDDAQHCYERWINPSNVLTVRESPAALTAFFFGQIPYDVATMRRLMDHGTTSDQYINAHAERVAMFRKRDADATTARTGLNHARDVP